MRCGVSSAPNTYRDSAAACAEARVKHVRSLIPSHSRERCWRASTCAGRQFVSGSGEGQRSGESRGTLADVVEREEVSNQRARCRVLVPTMLMRLRADMFFDLSRGILIGLHPVGLVLDDWLTPSPPLRPQEPFQIKGSLPSQHEVDGTPELVGKDRQRSALSVLALDAREELLSLGRLRQEQHRGL